MSSSWLVTQCRQFCDQCLQNTWGFACEAQAKSHRFSGVAAKAAWRPSAIRECRQVVWRRCVSCICIRSEVHRASFSVFAAAPALVQSSSPGRCGVTLADCCCGSRDVAASHSHTVVAAAETLRRHIRRLLLRQQRRCGVTFAHCCCGSRDVAASHSHTAVAAAETLRRHTFRLLLRQQSAPSPAMSMPHVKQASLSVASASCCAYSRVALSGRTLLSRSPAKRCCGFAANRRSSGLG